MVEVIVKDGVTATLVVPVSCPDGLAGSEEQPEIQIATAIATRSPTKGTLIDMKGYSLTAPAVSPLIICFWNRKKVISTGIVTTTDAALIRSNLFWY